MIQLNIACLITVLLTLFKSSQAYMITIDARGQECFHEKVEPGTKMSLMFEIVEGGFNDIEIKINDPEGKVIHEGDKETSGKYTFSANIAGTYSYCFLNEKGSQVPKTVMFTMDLGETPRAGAANEGEEGHNKLEDMIRELNGGLTLIKHEQEYMNVRDRLHRAINESTNSRVVLWSTFEALVLVIMTVGQVYYLKRFFEVRRVV